MTIEHDQTKDGRHNVGVIREDADGAANDHRDGRPDLRKHDRLLRRLVAVHGAPRFDRSPTEKLDDHLHRDLRARGHFKANLLSNIGLARTYLALQFAKGTTAKVRDHIDHGVHAC